MNFNIGRVFFLFLTMLSFSVLGQDTISFYNGNELFGELKSMNKGVLTFETPYSESDFKIDWMDVKRLHTTTAFLITLSTGDRLHGSVVSEDSVVTIISPEGQTYSTYQNNIVFLKSINSGFWSKMSANIDVGYNMTKANNLRQISVAGGIGYLAEKWSLNGKFNSLNSVQDSVDATLRNDGAVTVNIFLPKDWFLLGALDYLSNTEQLLDLRLNSRAGLGYFLVHSNTWTWGVTSGIAVVDEKFSSSEQNRNSMEGFIGTEINMFDIGDLNFYTKITAYPGITEEGRFRTDFKMELKYDFVHDFYIKGGLTVNYDNQPAVGASDVDYILNTGIGWEW